MSADQDDLYSLLGLTPAVTQEEIRAAYLRSVRRHPPDRDPDGFRRIQAAYDVLRQESSRKEYDRTRGTDPEARALFDDGRTLLAAGKAADALPKIKRALVRQPNSSIVRDLLVQALIATNQHEEAEKQAHLLLRSEPDNPDYAVRIGDILRTRDHDAEALPYYRKAVALDRANADNVVKLAYLLNYLGQPDEAFKLLEKGIARDGRVDFDDFAYFKCLYTILTLRERYQDLETTHQRIRSILPPDPEQRSFVAFFYYENAMRMARLGKFEAAVRSIEEAGTIDSSLPVLAETLARLRNSRAAVDELPRLRDDGSLEIGLRMTCVAVGIRRLLGGSDNLKELFEKASDVLNDEIATAGCNIGSQVRIIQARYPAFAALLAELLEEISRQDAQVPKRFIRLLCPQCGQTGHTAKPTVQNLTAKGLNVATAQAVLRAKGEQGALRLLSFTCQKCNTSFNGMSERETASPPAPPPIPPAATQQPCFVVTASHGDAGARPVRVLRAYRDEVLAGRGWGRLLIRLYGLIGPPLARCIVLSPGLREASRRACDWLARRVEGPAERPATDETGARLHGSSRRTTWRTGGR